MNLFLGCFCLLFASNSQAQYRLVGLPVQWAQWTQSIPQINPAYTSKEGKLGLMIGNMSHLGLWRNNNTYTIQADARLGKDTDEKNGFHAIGAYLIGDKEGQFLDRTRAYGIYAYHVRLREEMYFSAGIALGWMNYVASANDYNAGGSANVPDGNLGIALYTDSYHIGLSSNQLFNSELKPISEVTVLKRHYNLVASKTFTISPNLEFMPFGLVRWLPSAPLNFNGGLKGIISEAVSLGVNYQHQQAVVGMIGLEKIQWGSSEFRAGFSYSIPLPNNQLGNIQTVEITLGYLLKNNEQLLISNEQ